MSKTPLKVVMIRRGKSNVSNVASPNLITFIRKKVLLGSDELSGDGKNWIRVDRHYQLRKYFANNEEVAAEPVADKPKPEKYAESDEFRAPPGLTNNLEELADLLKDINS
jgi:hypothetical protein